MDNSLMLLEQKHIHVCVNTCISIPIFWRSHIWANKITYCHVYFHYEWREGACSALALKNIHGHKKMHPVFIIKNTNSISQKCIY